MSDRAVPDPKDDKATRAGSLHWTRTRGFNPGSTYLHFDADGRLVWMISSQPDGPLWQLGSSPALSRYGHFTLHATVADAIATAEDWTLNHG